MKREDALELWDAIFGNEQWAVDCFGTWMYREDYGDTETKRLRPNGTGKRFSYGWEVDHIRPKSDFKNESEADFANNYEPVHWNNNREKADNYPQFAIKDKNYKVVRCEICSSNNLVGYGIADEDGNRIDWKFRQKEYFKNN